jgi:hypothetical protein
MYSHLMPEDIRLDMLFHGLNQPLDSYAVLASIVGLQDAEPDEAARATIVQRLIEIIQNGPQVTAARASVLLSELAGNSDVERIAPLLDHPDDSIRHNVLVALIKAAGLQNVSAALAQASISPDARAYAEAKLAGWERFYQNGELNYGQWYLSDLSAPLLTYIPNLKDFSA